MPSFSSSARSRSAVSGVQLNVIKSRISRAISLISFDIITIHRLREDRLLKGDGGGIEACYLLNGGWRNIR